MSRAMDRIRREAIEKYGDEPADATEALAHVLKVLADEPGSLMVVQATSGIYGNQVRTGLTLGDLRGIAGQLSAAKP